MANAVLRSFIRWLFRSSRPVRPATRRRLGIEPLEDRLAPATWAWTGAVNSGTAQAPVYNWSAAGNFELVNADVQGLYTTLSPVLDAQGNKVYNSPTNEPTTGDDL